MREFCKFSPEFWSSPLAGELRKIGSDALLLASYLQTNRHSNMIGVYYLPLVYISYDTGLQLDQINKLLEEFCELNFCHYDREHGYIWVVELGFIQTGGALKEHDKRVIQMRKLYEALPMVYFLPSFYEKYHQLYHLKGSPQDLQPHTMVFEGTSKALRSKKKNKKKNKKKEKNKKKDVTSTAITGVDQIMNIFNHWKSVMHYPEALMDSSRKGAIKKALSLGYRMDELCQAITGCSYTPHNMGHNEQKQRFDGLKIIFRDADQIDRFIRNYRSPPPQPNVKSDLLEHNQAEVNAWLEEEGGQIYDSK